MADLVERLTAGLLRARARRTDDDDDDNATATPSSVTTLSSDGASSSLPSADSLLGRPPSPPPASILDVFMGLYEVSPCVVPLVDPASGLPVEGATEESDSDLDGQDRHHRRRRRLV